MPSPFSALTTSTDIEETIPTELINTFCEAFQNGPQLARVVGRVDTVPKGNGTVYRLPRWNDIDASAWATHTQGDYFAESDATTAEESITAAVLGRRFPLSNEAEDDGVVASVPSSLLAQVIRAVQYRMELDLFAQVDNITLEHDATPSAFTPSVLKEALAAWDACRRPGTPVVVIPQAAWDTFADALTSTGAVAASQVPMTKLYAGLEGYKGEYLGAQLFVSPYLAVDAGVASAVITRAGQQSGLVTALWHDIRATVKQVEEAYSSELIVAVRYGCGMSNNHATRPHAMRLLTPAT